MAREKKAVTLLGLIESLSRTDEAYDFQQGYHVVRFSDGGSVNPPRLFSGSDSDAWDFIKNSGDPDLVMVNDAGIMFPLPPVDAGQTLKSQPQTFDINQLNPPGEW